MTTTCQWIAPSLGLMNKVGDNTYSNEEFINTISRDDTPIGQLMSMNYGLPTVVTVTQGVPASWVQWDVDDTENVSVDTSDFFSPEEILGDKRLWVPRGVQSKRIRSMMGHAGFSIKNKGLVSTGTPESLELCIKNIVYAIYMVAEKNTIASLKNTSNSSVSKSRMKKMLTAYDVIHDNTRLIDICLLSAYSEPSVSTMERFFYVSTVLGEKRALEIINNLYHDFFEEQVFSIEESLHLFVVPSDQD